jgi:predicted phosphodiesterase
MSDDLKKAIGQQQTAPTNMPTFAETDEHAGKAAVLLENANATARDLVIGAGLDPDLWQIAGKVNTRRWMRYDQAWLYYYAFNVVAGESPEARQLHVDDLVKRIRKHNRYGKRPARADNNRTFVLVLSDWQIGKAENGLGSDETIRRWKDCLAQVMEQIRALRKTGTTFDSLAILSVGDLVEGCDEHYAMQTFSVDLDRRAQARVVRELLTETILKLAPMFDFVDVAVVGGNHGENRKEGKAFTTFADNDDVAAPEAVKEAFELAEYENLYWTIPNEELSVCLDLGGVKIGLAHGHQFKGGVNAAKKAEDWWRAQDFGLQAVRDAQILLTGHFHHLALVNLADRRTWIQAPTIDPGSKWYTDVTGSSAIPGVLTMVLDAEHPLGYDHLRMLTPAPPTEGD